MRLVPDSLFGRLMAVLAAGLVVAQLLSAGLTLYERDSTLARAAGVPLAQRIADIVKWLDSSTSDERTRIVRLFNVPPLVVSLDRPPIPEADRETAAGPRAAMFGAMLRASLGDDRTIHIGVTGTPPEGPRGQGFGRGGMGRGKEDFSPDMPMRGPGMHRFPPHGVALLTQVRLQDGTWASFDTELPQPSRSLPWRLLATLVVLVGAVLVLSLVAVGWLTRPLKQLATAAEALGQDIHRPPLAEAGPREVRSAAHAFNTMQSRIAQQIEDRSRMLAAMSHDLKTPLTRMRLRTELLEDAELRARFERDLLEMETMVADALQFMRGTRGDGRRLPLDLTDLLRKIVADQREMGRQVGFDGEARIDVTGDAELLRRCVGNLVDNAVLYGGRAEITASATARDVLVRIRDHGPGIPEAELEKVFDPFYRLDASRSRETGGTGLGLSIARSIARAHGGEIQLRNHPEGGLEALLSLPAQRES